MPANLHSGHSAERSQQSARPGVVGGDSAVRALGTATGLLVWLVALLTQRRAFRASNDRGVEPASLVLPGLVAAVGFGLIESAFIVALLP